MPSMKFRFTTECEMTLCGASYEEIYLKFKDFQHGAVSIQKEALVAVCPPESQQMFFSIDDDPELHEISAFKGDFRKDIASHCEQSQLQNGQMPVFKLGLSDSVAERIAEVY